MTSKTDALTEDRVKLLQAYPGKALDLDIALMADEILASRKIDPVYIGGETMALVSRLKASAVHCDMIGAPYAAASCREAAAALASRHQEPVNEPGDWHDTVKAISYELCMHKELRITLGQMEHIEQAVSSALRAASIPKVEPAPVVTDAARDVLAERKRQVEAEGWTPVHDDQHDRGEMATAAGCYALSNKLPIGEVDGPGSYAVPRYWPWDPEWWKPSNRRRELVKAGALILAEIERLDRASLQKQESVE